MFEGTFLKQKLNLKGNLYFEFEISASDNFREIKVFEYLLLFSIQQNFKKSDSTVSFRYLRRSSCRIWFSVNGNFRMIANEQTDKQTLQSL